MAIADFQNPGLYFSGSCEFDAAATVPDAPFYAVDLGRRGSVQFTHEELVSHGWQAAAVGLSL